MGLWVVALNNLVILGVVARRALREQVGYMALLGVNLVLAFFLLFTDRVMSVWSFVCIGAFVFMVLLPPFVDRAARRAIAAEKMKLAIWLTGLRELLQPGANVGQLRKALEPMARVRRGETEEVLSELEEEVSSLDGAERKALQIQKLSVLLYARRWEEALNFFEENLPAQVIAFHPPLAAGMIRAFGETGKVSRMTAMMGLLEDSPGVAEGNISETLDQARMVYLAFAGRYEQLTELLHVRSGFAQTADTGTRDAWLGIAAKTSGKKDEAKRILSRALSKLKGPSVRRELERHLEELDAYTPPFEELGEDAVKVQTEKVYLRAAVKAGLPRVRGGHLFKIAPLTAIFVLICVAVWLAMEIVGEGSGDPATLVLWGANLKGAVRGGQHFRLVSSVFLHAHWIHLGLNMLVLAILGRMAEQIVGSFWFAAVFVLAGVVGSLASFALGDAPLSVGASGSIFGVLGAMIAALATGKGRWPDAWRRSLMTILLILGGLSLLPGLQMKVIDNWAHIGGLVGGAVVGGMAWLSYSRTEWMRWISAVVASLCGLAVLYAGVMVGMSFREPLPWVSQRAGDIALELPAGWVPMEERTGYYEFHNIMSRERVVVMNKPPNESTARTQAACVEVFSREVEDARREAGEAKAALREGSRDLYLDGRPRWHQQTLSYEMKDAKLSHGVYVRYFGASRESCVVVHYLCMSSKTRQAPRFLTRLLNSVKLN